MKENKTTKCPVCGYGKYGDILNLDCGSFDDSALYGTVRVLVCQKCGHIFNQLSPDQIIGLEKYYNYEYASQNVSSNDKTGDRPGSNNSFTLARYGNLYNLIKPFLKKNSKIMDVGCATGGFLDYLCSKGFKNLCGIDISKDYLKLADKRDLYELKFGNAQYVPFKDDSVDVIVIDQVMEHLHEPEKAFEEAGRVLKRGGLFCVSIPDASRYGEKFFFDFYWFLLKEHIQHFDLEHLKLLAAKKGFEFIDYRKTNTPMMSEKMILPALSVVFRSTGIAGKLTGSKKLFSLEKQIQKYIRDNLKRLESKKKILNKLAKSRKPVYVWGMGRELLYLYESAGLKKCNIIGLVDANPYKQQHYTINGKRIADPSVLRNAGIDSFLIISAVAHVQAIKKELKQLGFRGEIVKI